MNKELINKYKPEFDHWLNGGSVLINSDLGWCPIAKEFAWSCNISINTLFVINDEYVEFRKALAEGKIIQVNNSNPEVWVDIDINKLTNYNSAFLRIKPDEPKFKVGDFVRYVNSPNSLALEIDSIDCNMYCIVNSYISYLEHELELWTPVKDEWCWFYNNKDSKCSHLAQFYDMNKSFDNSLSTFMSSPITKWHYCKPFLNSLPSHLKDK